MLLGGSLNSSKSIISISLRTTTARLLCLCHYKRLFQKQDKDPAENENLVLQLNCPPGSKIVQRAPVLWHLSVVFVWVWEERRSHSCTVHKFFIDFWRICKYYESNNKWAE